MYPPPDNKPVFRCPICRSRYFAIVTVERKDRPPYRTGFYECSCCSVMFRDVAKFTLFEPYEPPRPTAADERKRAVKLAYFNGRDRE